MRYQNLVIQPACAVAATLIAVPAASAATPSATIAFRIPAQDLAHALQAFARQAGVQLLFPSESIRGRKSKPVIGRLDRRRALNLLIADTGLRVARDDGQVIALALQEDAGNVPSPAAARDNDADREIVVTGFRSSLAKSLEEKRDANQVMDAITAEDVGKFPDQNVAEAIQRISGVSITRNNGEGESVTIRGLSPEFTRIEIDGRTTMVSENSADPERTSVLSTFASDLYSSIQVVKSPTAADVEGGIGGTVRLKTPDPLDIGKLKIGADVGGTAGDLRDKAKPSFLGFFSDTFDDNRVGVLLTATYEERDRRLDSIEDDKNWAQVATKTLSNVKNPALTSLVGGWYPGELREESHRGSGSRLNINGKIQFRPAPNFTVYANGIFTSEVYDEQRSRLQITWSKGQITGGTLDPATDTLTAAQFTGQTTDFRQFFRHGKLTTYGITSGFTWTPANWKIDAEASTSYSREFFAEYRAEAELAKDKPGGYQLTDDPRYPIISLTSAGLDPAPVPLEDLQLQQRIISLQESHYQLNARRDVTLGPITGLQLGVRYEPSTYDRKEGAVARDGDGLTYADAPNTSYVLHGDFGQGFGHDLLQYWPSVDPLSFYRKYPPAQAFSYNDENLYSINEDVMAGYAMSTFDASVAGGVRARGNLGVRIVHTRFSGQGRVNVSTATDEFLIDNAPPLNSDRTDVLPAFNIVFAGSKDAPFLVRGAVTRALSQPTISAIQPGVVVHVDDATATAGNPNLKPFLAWQYDLGGEWYFGKKREGLLGVSLFAKQVDNFIVEENITENLAFPEVGIPAQDYLVDTYRNGGHATIRGAEVNFQTPFTFLPGPLKHFGIYANYTYTDSNFTDGDGTRYTFPGASRNTFNLVGYYERGGFSIRAAYNYRDKYLVTPSTSADGSNAVYAAAQGRLDLGARYRLKNGVRLSVDVLNLTNEQKYQYFDTSNRINDLEFEGRIYSISAGFIF